MEETNQNNSESPQPPPPAPPTAEEKRLAWFAGQARDGSAAQAPVPSPAARTFRCGDLGDVEIPRLLGGYELGEEIGSGAFGAVFHATHVQLKRACAVKVLLAEEVLLPGSQARFRREAQTLARMARHPHIVEVFDMGIEGRLLYYAMEVVEGETLEQRCARQPLSPTEAALLLEKVARALHFAHQRNVIHRDVKPENILLREGEPLIADFGLARDLASGTPISHLGQAIGTPAYMSPEQARGEEVDARTDVYSVGAVMYEVLTGEPLYETRAPAVTMNAVVAGKFPPPREVVPGLPPALEAICLRCLANDRGLRYATAHELAEDLALWLREGRSRAAEGAPAPSAPEGPRLSGRLWDDRGSLRNGTVLDGYRIDFFLGRGTMGEVYAARQVHCGERLVALKVLSGLEVQSETVATRFRREAYALGLLDHPNIVRIIDARGDGERLYYSMEYVHGGNLRACLRLWNPKPAHRLKHLAQILSAIEYAHSHGVLHRDLKPENILIGFRDVVKLADFGLARMLFHRDRTRLVRKGKDLRVIGTLPYQAPEQRIDPSRVDERADLYSVGVIAYEMLTGGLPTPGCAPPSKACGLPSAIDDVVMSLLSPDPEHRPPLAHGVREAVERILHGLGGV